MKRLVIAESLREIYTQACMLKRWVVLKRLPEKQKLVKILKIILLSNRIFGSLQNDKVTKFDEMLRKNTRNMIVWFFEDSRRSRLQRTKSQALPSKIYYKLEI